MAAVGRFVRGLRGRGGLESLVSPKEMKRVMNFRYFVRRFNGWMRAGWEAVVAVRRLVCKNS